MTEPSSEMLLPVDYVETTTRRASVWLDVVAMLAVAAGVAWGLWPWLGPFAIAIGGVLLALIVYVSDAINEPHPGIPAAVDSPQPPPGPADPGNLHVSGA